MHGSRYSLDAIVQGLEFLTALECDQEILIIWNGYRCIRFLPPTIQDRTAACDLIRSKVAMEAGITWPRDEWQGTNSPHNRAARLESALPQAHRGRLGPWAAHPS